MELGKNIARIRKENNLTQDELAEKYYVTRQTISNWEIGKSYPDLETIVKISDDFNISLDVLLKDDSKMVKEIDKKIKDTYKYKKILKYTTIIGSLLLLAIFIYTSIYFYFRNTVVNKFEKSLAEYNFKMNGYGIHYLKYDDEIEYRILKQEFPKIFDFKLDYSNKSLNCSIMNRERHHLTEILWTNEGKILINAFICENKCNMRADEGNCGNCNMIGSFEISNFDNINYDEIGRELMINKDILKSSITLGTDMYEKIYY